MPENNEKRERPREAPPTAHRKHRRHRRMGAWGALVYVMAVIGSSAILAGVGWVAACDVLALNKPALETAFTVTEGQSVGQVAGALKDEGLVDHPVLFQFFAGFTHKGDEIVPGTYTLNTTMDYSAILRNLSAKSGTKTEVTITIKEGVTSAQIFQLLADQNVATVKELEEAAANHDFKFSFLQNVVALGDPNRLEGYLFPDTYQFFENMEPVQALNKMLLRFDEVMTSEIRTEITNSGKTMAQMITIASLIEKETTGDDQSHISSVIYNRLDRPNSETAGYLNIDATIQYVLPQRKGQLTASDLEVDSPYNTKNNKGLPPGPIANPGQASIRAALQPDSTKDYFYALGDDGAHHFFRTYQQQKDFKATQELYKNAE